MLSSVVGLASSGAFFLLFLLPLCIRKVDMESSTTTDNKHKGNELYKVQVVRQDGMEEVMKVCLRSLV